MTRAEELVAVMVIDLTGQSDVVTGAFVKRCPACLAIHAKREGSRQLPNYAVSNDVRQGRKN